VGSAVIQSRAGLRSRRRFALVAKMKGLAALEKGVLARAEPS